MNNLNGYEPEFYRKFINDFLNCMHESYPDGKIDTINNTKYYLALLVSFRLGYENISSMFEAYGFHVPTTRDRRQVITIESTKDERYGVLIPTVLPPTPHKEAFDYEIHALYGDGRFGQVQDIDDTFAESERKYIECLQNIESLLYKTSGVNENGLGYVIKVNNPWFNERTNLSMLEKISEAHGIKLPFDFFSRTTINHGYKFYYYRTGEEQERRRKQVKEYMALASLFLYPGSDVYVEVSEFSDNTFMSSDRLAKYKKEHPGKTYLIVNSDIGVRIESFPGSYKFSGKDMAGAVYNKLLKKRCPEDYIDLRIEGHARFIRIKKETIDGHVCIDGVPLDLYECVHFDAKQNAYIVSELPPIEVSEGEYDGIKFWRCPKVFDWDPDILPRLNNSGLNYCFPEVPRVDALHKFLNKCEKNHHIIAVEDIENIIYLYNHVSLGNIIYIKTLSGDSVMMRFTKAGLEVHV